MKETSAYFHAGYSKKGLSRYEFENFYEKDVKKAVPRHGFIFASLISKILILVRENIVFSSRVTIFLLYKQIDCSDQQLWKKVLLN